MKNFVIPTMDTPKADTLSEYLNSSIEAFSNITGISVTYFNDSDKIVKEFKKDDKICNIFCRLQGERQRLQKEPGLCRPVRLPAWRTLYLPL